MKTALMKQIISLSIVSIAFDTAEMRRMNQTLGRLGTGFFSLLSFSINNKFHVEL